MTFFEFVEGIKHGLCIGPMPQIKERCKTLLITFLKAQLDRFEVKSLGRPGTIGVHQFNGAKAFVEFLEETL